MLPCQLLHARHAVVVGHLLVVHTTGQLPQVVAAVETGGTRGGAQQTAGTVVEVDALDAQGHRGDAGRLTQLEHQVAELRGQAESISRDMTVRVGELERRARQAEAPDPMDLFKEDDWNEN